MATMEEQSGAKRVVPVDGAGGRVGKVRRW